MKIHLSRRGVGALLVVVALALVAGVALAAIPGDDGVISGCYAKKDGSLRLIDAESGKSCAKNEKPISWSSGGGATSPDDFAGTPCTIGDRTGQTIVKKPDSVAGEGFSRMFELSFQCAVPDFYEPNDTQSTAAVINVDPGTMVDFDATIFPAGDVDWYVANDRYLAAFCVDPIANSQGTTWEVYKDGVLVASGGIDQCYGGDVEADWTFKILGGSDISVHHVFIGL